MFDAQRFLESAGVAKEIVKYGRGDAVFTQGDAGEFLSEQIQEIGLYRVRRDHPLKINSSLLSVVLHD